MTNEDSGGGKVGEARGTGPMDPGGGFQDIFCSLSKDAKNGMALNGILTWIDVQQRSTPTNIWMAQAVSSFCDDEVEMARATLWRVAEKNSQLIRNIVGHESPGKKRKECGGCKIELSQL